MWTVLIKKKKNPDVKLIYWARDGRGKRTAFVVPADAVRAPLSLDLVLAMVLFNLFLPSLPHFKSFFLLPITFWYKLKVFL